MDITPSIPENLQVIDSYGPGRFQVSGTAYQGPLLVFPRRVVAWTLTDPDGLTVESLSEVIAAEPPVEILLFGCGERMTLVKPSLRQEIRDSGIAMDPMDTGAACRTYNILLAEGRRVAAALVPV
ncbi:MAG: Mth938-like domain-containing protein [Alphaproteobacteria bacterium]